jgi:hypothetical protein
VRVAHLFSFLCCVPHQKHNTENYKDEQHGPHQKHNRKN